MGLNSLFLTASLGTRMKEAGLNTLVGMIVVFSVLILIALIISLFKYLPNNLGQEKDKAQPKVIQKSDSRQGKSSAKKQIKETSNQELTNNTELVAVITAAIMSSMEEEGIVVPEDGLIIKSIRRKTAYK